MVKALSSYKIAFNYNIADDINYRTFEATAAGAMLLTNYTPNLEKLFEIGKEVVTYSSVNDLIDKISYYAMQDEERSTIASKGAARSRGDHSYDIRARQFISIINDLRS
jgi:spore maturation protein CgeB